MNSGSEDEINKDDDLPVENFKIIIPKASWIQLSELIEPDGKFPDRCKLKTEYVKLFENEISNHENMKICLRDRKSRIYTVKRKRSTNYMVGYTICYECLCKYYFTVRDKPTDVDLSVEILVKKVGVHEHTGKRIKAADKIRNHRNNKNKQIKLNNESPSKTVNDIINNNCIVQAESSSNPFIVLGNHLAPNILMNENYESIEIYRNLFRQYETKEVNNQDLYNNLIYVANTQKTCIPALIVHGFLRNIKIYEEFSLTMHSEYQLKSIESVQYADRVLHLGFVANLIKLNGSLIKSKLYNHFVLLKDFRSIGLRNVKSLLISEMVSSKFNAYTLAEFYRLIRKNYNDIYPKLSLKFQYIVVDFLWESIHSSLEVFNNESIIEYSNRVYEYLQTSVTSENKSWVITCASHTLTKFIANIKREFKDSKLRMIACFVFSLMLNSTDLDSLSKYFRLICFAFLSRTRTELNYSSLREIQSLISRRSKDESEILKCLNSIEIVEKNLMEHNKEVWCNQIDVLAIKENSPFTDFFKNIENEALRELSLETSSSIPNPYFSIEFIKFLQENFMPYVFLWVSFGLKNNENQITRMTNGLLDQYIGLKKNVSKQEGESIKPAQYAMLSYPQVRHKTEQFLKYQQEELQKKIDDFKFNENESYYVTSTDDYLENDKDENVEYVDVNLNEIEFEFF